MERYDVCSDGTLMRAGEGELVKYADAQRALDALQAQVQAKDAEIAGLKRRIDQLESREIDVAVLQGDITDLTRANARLMEALDKLARLGNEPHYGNSTGNVIAQHALADTEGQNLTTKEVSMHATNFEWALMCLKNGQRVARTGWNGKGMFLFLVPGSTFQVNRAPLLGIYPEGTTINYQPHIDMRTANGTIVPWLASQSDLLADDWETVEP